MAYCTKCGTKSDDDSTFCIQCGTNLGIGTDTTKKTVKKYKFNIKTLAIIIVIAIISASIIFLYSGNINRYGNTEDSTVVSDKDAIVISDGNTQIASNQETAQVSISSIPSGANIYINNISKGKTPAKINLPDGQYSLRMNITGYKSIMSEFNVTIKPNQDTDIILNATLEPGNEPLTNESTNSTNVTNESTNSTNGSTNSTNVTNESTNVTNESTNSTNVTNESTNSTK